MLLLQLAESYPIRRAAQLAAYLFLRGKQLRIYLCIFTLFSWANTPENWLPSILAFCMLLDAINVLPQ